MSVDIRACVLCPLGLYFHNFVEIFNILIFILFLLTERCLSNARDDCGLVCPSCSVSFGFLLFEAVFG